MKNGITLLIFLTRKLHAQSLLLNLIKVINALFFTLKILHSQIVLCVRGSALQQVVYIAYSNVLMGSIQVFGLFVVGTLTALLVLLCCCLVYFAQSENSLVNKQGRPGLSSGLAIGLILVLLLLELTYSPLVLHLYANCRSILGATLKHQSIMNISFLIASAIMLGVVTVYNRGNRSFGVLAPFILVLMQTLELDLQISLLAEPLMLAVITCLFIYLDSKTLINRCIYYSYLCACLFTILDAFDSTPTGRELVFFIIALGCLQLIVVCRNYLQTQKFEQNQFLMESLQNIELGLSEPISIHIAIKIQFMLRYFAQKNANLISTRDIVNIILTKSVQEMSSQELLKIIDTKLFIEYLKDETDMKAKRKYFLFRINKSYLIMSAIDEISHFLHEGSDSIKKNNRSDPFRASKNSKKQSFFEASYAKKEVELSLFEYLSRQPDHDKVIEILRTSKQQEEFFDQSMCVLSHISSFWEKVNMEMLIESIIEDTFQQMMSRLACLHEVYKSLTEGYRGEWETKIIKFIYQLIEPCTVPKFDDVSLLSKQEELNEDALLYFVVTNKFITKASPHFLKLLDCKKQEIVGEELSKIVPEEVVRKLKTSENDSTFTQSQSSTVVPLIIGDHLIKILEVSIKLRPKITGGIQFFYFLNHASSEQKTAHLYISLLDLRVQYVSSDFYQHLSLEPSYLENKLNKNELCLNNIVTSIEANHILSELQRNKMLKCIVDVSKLRTKQKRIASQKQTKFFCILTVAGNFEGSMLVCLNVRESEVEGKRQSTNNFEFLKIDLPNKLKTIQRANSQFVTMEQQSLQASSNLEDESLKILMKADEMDNNHGRSNELSESKYCPISNPYRQKIEEKQSQISSETGNYFTYSTCIIALTCVLLLVMVGLIVALGVYNQSQRKNAFSIKESLIKIESSASLLVQGTLQVYWQYHLSAMERDFNILLQQQGLHVSVQDMLNAKYDRIHDILAEFYYKFTTFYQRGLFADTSPYTIVYAHYQIQTNYSTSNLLEYAYNIKLSSEKIRVRLQESISKTISFVQAEPNQVHPLDFFIKNYLTVSGLKAPFQVLDILTAAYRDNLKSMKLLIFVSAAAIPTLLVFIALAIKSHLKIMKQIFQIFAMMDSFEVKKRLADWEAGVALCMAQVPKDSQKKLWEEKSKNRESMIMYEQKIKQSTKKIRIEAEDEKFKSKQIFSDKNEECSYICKKMKGLFIFGLLFSVTVAAFFYKLEIDFKEDQVMIEYVSQIGRIQFNSLKNSADMFHYNIQNMVVKVGLG